ncbi:hypothetical protein [Aeromonas sp. MR16]|uniref:hypothetical protein n=1 Tax=Aeromonas sp. MR16 TaxID=2923420 RepID=UPI001F4BCB8C|nr:hypothetical protein [Aeromonas sp. MR16]MCH7372567.1 hypothetical protein [Aeromonas sp. MR16]
MGASWQDVALESVKILGPAIITALAAYFTAKFQFKIKVKEIVESNKFRAHERIFDFHKSKYDLFDKAILNINEGFGFFAGLSLSEQNEQGEIKRFVAKYLSVYIETAPLDLKQLIDEFSHVSELHTLEFERLKRQFLIAKEISTPTNQEEINDVIVKLLVIYGVANYCGKILTEMQAVSIFDKYIER